MNMQYEFLLRILIAGVLGALIGLERERRSKEAGLRTHFLVAVGSAVIMIISKYGFGDILSEEIVLDPSRVAAQVVSGIGFLGAGMIIVERASIHGLTTAAGIWATAGIGLAIGSGMYEIGVFASLLVIVGLEFLKMIFQPIIPQTYRIVIEATSHGAIPTIIQTLTDKDIKIKDYQVKIKEKAETTTYSVEFKVKSATRWEENELVRILQKIDDVQAVKFP
ncbi:MAG TPA: MgtC/SapB family protein [Pseudogracilibacillus sp.]|nr:MgtC/SapB family protein [Pseudogracilibacillus sp.]